MSTEEPLSTPAARPAPGGAPAAAPAPAELLTALKRYRIMAFTVGVWLIILVFVGIPLQIAGHSQLVAIVGPIHGFLYILYLLAALDLSRRARFTFPQMMAMVGGGLLPFLAFVIERKITRRVRTEVLPTWNLRWRRDRS